MSSDQTATVVVAAVIVQDGKVFIHKRGHTPREPSTSERWECSGGVAHFGEDFADALRREVREELGLEIRVGRLLHAQINTYDSGTDWLVLFYACTPVGRIAYLPDVRGRLVGLEELVEFNPLPGTLEAVSKLTAAFSFVQSDVGVTTPDETLHIMTYELGRLIEHHHKAKRYGEQGYLGSARKELAGLVSMCRMYCEQRGWDFEELMKLGEEDYLERMKDLRKHGVSELCAECGRTLPMHNPECSQNEKMY